MLEEVTDQEYRDFISRNSTKGYVRNETNHFVTYSTAAHPELIVAMFVFGRWFINAEPYTHVSYTAEQAVEWLREWKPGCATGSENAADYVEERIKGKVTEQVEQEDGDGFGPVGEVDSTHKIIVNSTVMVTWVDSANHAVAWTDTNEVRHKHQFAFIESVGIVSKIDNEGLTLIQSFCYDGPGEVGDTSANNAISIPKGCVLNMRLLK